MKIRTGKGLGRAELVWDADGYDVDLGDAQVGVFDATDSDGTEFFWVVVGYPSLGQYIATTNDKFALVVKQTRRGIIPAVWDDYGPPRKLAETLIENDFVFKGSLKRRYAFQIQKKLILTLP